jgi:hypothetical protein
MQWVTRRQIRVNRTGTAWLILRFIDPEAIFMFVDPADVAEVQRRTGATGFDAPGANYPHKDAEGRCSFEALAQQYRADDAALQRLARIVRSADFPEELSRTPEATGLRAISTGFPLLGMNDQEVLTRACFLYDALYASRQAQASHGQA